MDTRNPSPPGDILDPTDLPDKIGDTVYSKRWLHCLILKVFSIEKNDSSASDSDVDFDLESSLEEELCLLWDITSNKDILTHLREFNLISVFSTALSHVRCPRLVEISLGILANIIFDEVECDKITDDEAFLLRILNHICCHDTRILAELFRLLRTALTFRKNRQYWLDAIHYHEDFFDRIMYILRNCANASLLISVISAVETLLRVDDSISEIWCTESLLDSTLEAQKQMKCLYGDEVEVIHRLFYIFSSSYTGVPALMSRFRKLCPGFIVYLQKVCEDESHLIPFKYYHNSLRSIIPVIDVIVVNLPLLEALTILESQPDILRCLFKITLGCYQQNINVSGISLDGILTDLCVFFADLMLRVYDFLQENQSCNRGSDALSSVQPNFEWLHELDKSDIQLGESFVRCCLNSRSGARASLLFSCQKLNLANLLEFVTDNDKF